MARASYDRERTEAEAWDQSRNAHLYAPACVGVGRRDLSTFELAAKGIVKLPISKPANNFTQGALFQTVSFQGKL
jgi:hypothetical protein